MAFDSSLREIRGASKNGEEPKPQIFRVRVLERTSSDIPVWVFLIARNAEDACASAAEIVAITENASPRDVERRVGQCKSEAELYREGECPDRDLRIFENRLGDAGPSYYVKNIFWLVKEHNTRIWRWGALQRVAQILQAMQHRLEK